MTPNETVGPFPSLTDMIRSDIREGKPGTMLTLTVKVVNNTSDGIFSDSLAAELVTPTGNPTTGYVATFQVGVAL